jgi:dipeptidyl aminopeptidase/acylaminoacyl peptidase
MLAPTLLVAILFVLLLAASCAASPQPHPFNVHDLVTMRRLGDVQALPDRDRIVFTLRRTDMEAGKGVHDIYLANSDGSDLRRLTSHPSGSSHPRWAPDGSAVYFLSKRDAGDDAATQLWRIPVDGGEATRVTDLPLDIGSFVVSPRGDHLAISLEVYPGLSPGETKDRLDEEKKRKSTGMVYDKLFIRHWDEWKDYRRNHLFVVPVDGGPAVDLMGEMDADAPSKPFGGAEEYTFTPDGKELVFSCRDKGREEAWSTHFNLYAVPIDSSQKPRIIVDGEGATVTEPIFSRSGRTLAYLAMKRPGYEADRRRICLMDWPDGKPRALTEEWDRSLGAIVWSHDDKEIYTAANHLGHTPLFAVETSSGDVRTVVAEGKVNAIALAKDRLVYGWCHHQHPTDLYAISERGGTPTRITNVNEDALSLIRFGDSEQFTFKGWNDETVHAWVVKPVGFDAKKKYPVAYLIHGGPQGSFGADFHYRWNPQVYAGAGYAVVMVDFHGSTGYGQDFTDAINGHWGDRPFEDLQKGLAAAIERFEWMDGERVAALGGSFGGYMVNWIAGNWPDRFKCLVNHDGNIDERMAYYDTEELWFPEWERGGTPWEAPEAYAEHNPIDHVDTWQTPMLVIHGRNDYRVVYTQGISTFTALQRRGVPSKFLYFPDENHWVLRPYNSIQWYDEVIAWLDQWTK